MADRDPTGGRHVLGVTHDSSPPPRLKERLSRLETYLSIAVALQSAVIAVGSWAYSTMSDTRDQARATSQAVVRLQSHTSRTGEQVGQLRDDVRDLLHETRALNDRLRETREQLERHAAQRRHTP